MSRRAVHAVLVTHLLVVWAAVVFRVDRFPLTWAPMYTVRERGGTVDVPEWDRDRALGARRRDGRVESISASDLNIPTLSFWRLYYERAFGRPPNVHHHANAPMEPWCYLVRGLPHGQALYEADWSRRILTSVNTTLARDPDDPSFIVALEARATVTHFAQGDPDRWWKTDEVATLTWDESWNESGGEHGQPR